MFIFVMNSCLRQSLSKNESLLVIYLWRRKCFKIIKIHAQWLGAHSRLLYGLSDVPDLSIPLHFHTSSLLSTAIISLLCTGLQKIARLTTEHRLPAIKMHKKKMRTWFFLKQQIDEDVPKYLESGRAWSHLKSRSRNVSFSERQNENAFLFRSFLNFQKC